MGIEIDGIISLKVFGGSAGRGFFKISSIFSFFTAF
jgi:hypothetical protein